MKGQGFVLDAVRSMMEWAGDPDRGGLLPDGFRNPFLSRGESAPIIKGDPLADPDITLPMAVDFLQACDLYQLRGFAPLVFFGLRAAEPCFLFTEYLDPDWLRVPCNIDLTYFTKGRRDKRFPLIGDMQPLWNALRGGGFSRLAVRAPLGGAGQGKKPLARRFPCRTRRRVSKQMRRRPAVDRGRTPASSECIVA